MKKQNDKILNAIIVEKEDISIIIASKEKQIN